MSTNNIPDWAQELEPITAAQTPAPSTQAPSLSDAERIANARAKAKMASYRADLPFVHSSYHLDVDGRPETSLWFFSWLCFLAHRIRTTVRGRAVTGDWSSNGRYYARAQEARFDDGTVIPVDEIKQAYEARIAELGISQALLEEHCATPHSIAESRRFDDLSFEEKVRMFKER